MFCITDYSEYLEPDQLDLLIRLVEDEQAVNRESRNPFVLAQSLQRSRILGNNSQWDVYRGDLEALADAGLLRRGFSSKGTPNYTLTPRAKKAYAELKKRTPDRLRHIEDEVQRYLTSGDAFWRYNDAFATWRRAEEALWVVDLEPTEIGHRCREAMQKFAQALADRVRPEPREELPNDPQKTVARVRACLDALRSQLGEGTHAWLDALLVYWGTVSDLVQRQEHGAGKEGHGLHFEDARRVVFHTAIVMYELAKAEERSTGEG